MYLRKWLVINYYSNKKYLNTVESVKYDPILSHVEFNIWENLKFQQHLLINVYITHIPKDRLANPLN